MVLSLDDSRIEIFPPRRKRLALCSISAHAYDSPLLNIDQYDGKLDDLVWITVALIVRARRFEIDDGNVFELLLDQSQRIVARERQLSFVVVLQSDTANIDVTAGYDENKARV